MISLAQLAKGLAKVTLATVFTGSLAGAREAGIQALDLVSSDKPTGEQAVLDRVARELTTVAAGEGISDSDARSAFETTEEIFRRHALTFHDLTELQLDPARASRTLLQRGTAELRHLNEAEDALCRRAVESIYRSLLADAAQLPGLERAFQQSVLQRLEALSDLPERLRSLMATLSRFGLVDIDSLGASTFFAGGYARLEDAYLSPSELFNRLGLGAGLERFSPRPSLVREIDRQLTDPTLGSGWIVLEADAGLGKTALLAYLARTRRWAHHFAQRGAQETTDRVGALRSLAAQLIPACGLQHLLRGGGLPETAGRTDWFYGMLVDAAHRRSAAGIDTPLVMVVDGLDEAAAASDCPPGSIPLGLPESLPEGVFIVAGVRVSGDSAVTLPAEYQSIKVNAGDASNIADLRRRVNVIVREPGIASTLIKHGIDRDWFERTLSQRCGGVWVYLHHVAVEIRTGQRAPDDLNRLPASLWEYYRRNLTSVRDEDPGLWATHLPVLATLGVIGEPVSFELLCGMAEVDASPELRRTVDGPWSPFLQIQPSLGDGQHVRYTIYHASVGEFLSGQGTSKDRASHRGLVTELRSASVQAHRRIADRYLVKWGGLSCSLPGLYGLRNNPDEDNRYGLSHLTAHFHATGREDEVHQLLAVEQSTGTGAVNVWFDVLDRLGQMTRYLVDISRARERAERVTDAKLSEGQYVRSIGHEVRYALMDASVGSLAVNIPPALLARLVGCQTWTFEHALTYAKRHHDPNQRFRALNALIPYATHDTRDALFADALVAARSIVEDFIRVNALTLLVQGLTVDDHRGLLVEALDATCGIADEHARAFELGGLVRLLPADLILLALAAARDIVDVQARATALSALVAYLPADCSRTVLSETLELTSHLTDSFTRAWVLAELCRHVEQDARRAVISEGLSAASVITDGTACANALGALAPHIPDDLLVVALDTARGIADKRQRVRAFANLAEYLTVDVGSVLVADALRLARSITDPYARVDALRVLAPHLLEETRDQIFVDALNTCRAIIDDDVRAHVLDALVPVLPDTALDDALDIARGISNISEDGPSFSSARVNALRSLASQMPDDRISDILSVTRGIADESVRVKALAELLPYVAPGMRHGLAADAFDLARSITNERARGRALADLGRRAPADIRGPVLASALQAGLGMVDGRAHAIEIGYMAPHFPDDLLPDALAAARSINDEHGRAEAIGYLAPRLPDDLFPDALAAARSINDEHGRAEAIGYLAPRLPDALFPDALAAARSITDEQARAWAIGYLAPRLPDALFPDALAAARSITNEQASAWTLARLAPHTPDEFIPDAFAAASGITDDDARACALAPLAAHLPDPIRRSTWDDGLRGTKSISNEHARADALIGLATYLPNHLLPEALAAARGINDEHARADALIGLAAYLPDDLLPEALAAARGINDEHARADALIGLAAYLPDDLLPETLAAARGITNKYSYAKGLAYLAPRCPDEVFPDLLDLLSNGNATPGFADLPHEVFLSLIDAPELEFRHVRSALLPSGSRTDLLLTISGGAELLHSLGGQEVIEDTVAAIRDVARWWP